MNIIRKNQVNTNNAWGFGGLIGVETEYDNGIITIIGSNCHRHTGTSSANAIYVRIYKNFTIEVRKGVGLKGIATLNGIDTISIFSSKHGSHWQAIGKDLDSLELYGEQYKLVRKIKIN